MHRYPFLSVCAVFLCVRIGMATNVRDCSSWVRICWSCGCTQKDSLHWKADSGRKISCHTRASQQRQYSSWLFAPTLYQLSYPASGFLIIFFLNHHLLLQMDDWFPLIMWIRSWYHFSYGRSPSRNLTLAFLIQRFPLRFTSYFSNISSTKLRACHVNSKSDGHFICD